MRASNTPCLLLVGNRLGRRVTGVRLGFEILLEGLAEWGVAHRVLNKGRLGAGPLPALTRFAASLWLLVRYWAALPGSSRVYTTLARSRSGFLRDSALIWSARLAGRPIVLHLRGGGYDLFYSRQPAWMRWLMRITLARADCLIVLGELLRHEFDFVPTLSPRIQVVPNGVADDPSGGQVEPKGLPKAGPLRLLYLSNLMESKGYITLLEACRLLAESSGLEFRCDFCGDFLEPGGGSSPEEIRAEFFRKVVDWGLTDCVRYRGIVQGSAKKRLLAEAHLLVLPTRYPGEGQPLSILEALASATPIVSTRFRGIPELVVDGYNGFLVPADSAAEVAAAVQRVFGDAQQYATLSANARNQFVREFTLQAHLKRLLPVVLGTDCSDR